MPTLPTPESLGRVIPASPSHTPYVHDTSGVAKGVESLGGAIQEVAGDRLRQEHTIQLINAEARQQEGLHQLQRELMFDPDIDTHPQKFKTAADALTTETAGMLSNPFAKEQWIGRARMNNDTVLNSVLTHDTTIRNQQMTADLEDSLSKHIGITQDIDSTPEEIASARRSIDESVDLAARSRVITPLRALRLRQRTQGIIDEYLVRGRAAKGEPFANIHRDIWGAGGAEPKASKFSPEINDVINSAAEEEGVDPKLMELFAEFESSGNPRAGGKTYKGLYALSETEFAAHGGTGSIYNPAANARAAARKFAAEAKAFEDKHGMPPSRLDAWLIHNQGPKGYDALMENPDGIAWENIRKYYDSDKLAQDAIMGNMTKDMKAQYGSDVTKLTGGQFIDAQQERIGKLSDAQEYGGPYRNLTPQQRIRLTNVLKSAYRSQAGEDIKNSIEEIRLTGRAPVDENGHTALQRSSFVLTDAQRGQAQIQWIKANAEYKAKEPLSGMGEQEGEAYIGNLLPRSGDKHYDIMSDVHDMAAKEWAKIKKLRDHDAALSVENSDDVRLTKTAIAQRRDLRPQQKGELLLESRVVAQQKIQIPDYLQKLITRDEAEDLLQLPEGPSELDIDAAMPAASKRAFDRYGKYGAQTLRQAIHMRVKGKELREWAEGEIEDFTVEKKSKKEERGWFDWWPLGSSENKVPTQDEMSFVNQDPATRYKFIDNKYGAGTYSRIMAERARQ